MSRRARVRVHRMHVSSACRIEAVRNAKGASVARLLLHEAMDLGAMQAASDGFAEIAYNAEFRDPLARDRVGAYSVAALRGEVAQEMSAAAREASVPLSDDWSNATSDLRTANVIADVGVVLERFRTAEEIKQTLKEFFEFLFSDAGLELTFDGVETSPWHQRAAAMFPRALADAYEFVGNLFGVNASYAAAPLEDDILYFLPSTMRLCDGAIEYKMRGGTVALAISGLAKSPLLEHERDVAKSPKLMQYLQQSTSEALREMATSPWYTTTGGNGDGIMSEAMQTAVPCGLRGVFEELDFLVAKNGAVERSIVSAQKLLRVVDPSLDTGKKCKRAKTCVQDF